MTIQNKTIFPLCLVAYEMALYLSNDAYLPALPEVAHDLATTHYLVQLTLAVFCFGMLSMQIILAPIADRYGRRPLLLIGGLVFLLASLACTFANSIDTLLIARFFQGSAISSMLIAGYAAIHELFDSEAAIHTLARMSSITIIAPAFGPLLGSIILCFANWRWTFGLLFLWALAALIMLYYKMPETHVRTLENQSVNFKLFAKQYGRILRNGNFLAHCLSAWLLFGGIIAWIAVGPFLVISTFHYSPVYFGLFQIIVFGGFILGNYFVKKFMTEHNMKTLIYTGLSFALSGGIIVVLLGFYFPNFLVGLIIALFLLTFGGGLCMPILNRLAVESAPKEPMGARISVSTSMQSLIATLSTAFAAAVSQGKLINFACVILLYVILALSSYVFLKRIK